MEVLALQADKSTKYKKSDESLDIPLAWLLPSYSEITSDLQWFLENGNYLDDRTDLVDSCIPDDFFND